MSDVVLEEKGLTLALAGGGAGYFNYFWLRDNCASSFDPGTQERVYEISTAPDDLRAVSAEIVDGDLVIAWSDGGVVSRYDLAWLTQWARNPGRADSARIPRRPWLGDHYDRIPRFRQPDILTSDAVLEDWLEVLLRDGIAIVTDMANEDAALADLATRIGIVRPCIDGYFLDIESKPEGHSLSFTAAGLEIHTDIPAEELAPGVQFLHCRVNDAVGGESLFVDGVAVAETFRETHPEAFDLLSSIDIPFFYHHETFDLRSRQRIIELDDDGAVSGITLSGHMQDVFDLDQRFLDRFYPALMAFHRAMNDPKYLMRFRMKAGECLVFDNHRIAHGRAPYDPSTGYRRLRLCYVDRGELRSTYRTLRKRAAAEAAE
jgi:gamma-butyrobetaine dioxygenase